MEALENIGKEIIALVPVLLVLMRRLDFPALMAAAASLGAAVVGAAFSPHQPLPSGHCPEAAAAAAALGRGVSAGTDDASPRVLDGQLPDPAAAPAADAAGTSRHRLLLLFAVFALFTYGAVRLDWDFDQMSALFLGLGIGAGLPGSLGLSGTANGFVAGFRDMAFLAILAGFARAIFVVLKQGHMVDTIVRGLAAPLAPLPMAAAALSMMGVQTALHQPVPSVSGQATLTMPPLVPLSDLIGLSRQVTVLAFSTRPASAR